MNLFNDLFNLVVYATVKIVKKLILQLKLFYRFSARLLRSFFSNKTAI